MAFVKWSVAALSPLLVLLIFRNTLSSEKVALYFSIFTWGGLGCLTFLAVRFRRKGERNFDMLVASETIVVYGILSLILSIVLSISIAVGDSIPMPPRTVADLRPVLVLFGEGLIASGVAPFLANLLRQYEVVRFGGPPSGGGTDGMGATAADLESLRLTMHRLREEADSFSLFLKTKSDDIETRLTAQFKAIEEGMRKLKGSIGAVDTALTSGVERVNGTSRSVGKAAGEIADATKDLATTTKNIVKQLDGFANASVMCTENIRKMNLLTENVGRMIENLENFFTPAGRPDER